jgi:hypothetical protein
MCWLCSCFTENCSSWSWSMNPSPRAFCHNILTSQNTDTPEGLESRLSVKIHRIPAELPHSIEQELGNLRRTRIDSGRASALKLLWGLLTSREVLRLSEPRISLSTLQEWTWEHYGGLNLTLFTLSAGGTMVFIGGVGQCCSQRLGAWGPLIRPTDHATWPSGQVSSLYHLWALDTLSTASDGHVDKTVFGDAPTHGRPTKVMWPAGYTLAWFSLCLVPHHFLVSYCLWLCLILDIMKICMDFRPYDAFPSADVPEMVDQQNLWTSLVVSTYLL